MVATSSFSVSHPFQLTRYKQTFLSTISSIESWIYDTLRITTMHHWNQCLQDWFCKRRISGADFTTEAKTLRLESMVRVDRVDHLNRMAFWSVRGTYKGIGVAYRSLSHKKAIQATKFQVSSRNPGRMPPKVRFLTASHLLFIRTVFYWPTGCKLVVS